MNIRCVIPNDFSIIFLKLLIFTKPGGVKLALMRMGH